MAFKDSSIVGLLLVILVIFASLSQAQNHEWGPLQTFCPQGSAPRPDPKLEVWHSNVEVITGTSCFTLQARPYKAVNSFHVTLIKHDRFAVCKMFQVKAVEILGLGFYPNGTHINRHSRQPFGSFVRESGPMVVGNLTCGHNGQYLSDPVDDFHINLVNSSSVTLNDDCVHSNGGFVKGSDPASSIRFTATSGSLGQSGSNGDTVVACAIWTYHGLQNVYPTGLDKSKKIYMDFVAEMDIDGPNNQKMYRLISKLATTPVIKAFTNLICRYLVPTTPPPSTIAPANSSTPITVKPSTNGTTKPTPPATTASTPPPVYQNRPCEPHDTCAKVNTHLSEPGWDSFSSTYISVSDACKCRSKNIKTGHQYRKYPYGGHHFGLPLPPGTPTTDVIPPTPVKDILFDQCLQFYFDTVTHCAIFRVSECNAPPVKHLELNEIYIFALGATSQSERPYEGKPFGRWEPMDDSMGNCGNLINSKAKSQSGQLWSKHFGEGECNVNPLGLDEKALGMGDKYPAVWRLKLDTPLVLQGGTSKPKPLVYAVRLQHTGFTDASVLHRPEHISFVAEAYTTIKTEYETANKVQIFSFKTPIVRTSYHEVGLPPMQTTNLDILPNIATGVSSYNTGYFQLPQSWNDPLYIKDQTCPTNYIMGAVPPKAPPVTKVDYENTCRCYAKLRPSVDGKIYTVPEFIAKISKQTPSGNTITEDCFEFGFVPNAAGVVPGGSSGCLAGVPQNRVLVYFGMKLKCIGPSGLEVLDLVLHAQNHKNFPVGFWETPTVQEQGTVCKAQLSTVSGTSPTEWKIRDLLHIAHYNCPELPKPFYGLERDYFLHVDIPGFIFFNNKLTQDAGITNTYHFGFCGWWMYHNIYNHVTSDPINFYFDFQFVATAHILHRQSNTEYLVTFRSDRAGYNVKLCQAETLSQDVRQRNIFLDKDYYNAKISPNSSTCLVPLSRIDTFQTGLCGCFVGSYPHRFQASGSGVLSTPEDVLSSELRQCLHVSAALDNDPQAYSVVVSVDIYPSACWTNYRLHELVIQVMNNYGLPMGTWDHKLIQGGKMCEKANVVGEADVQLFSCPYSSKHKDLYKTDTSNINILHFQNRWQDDQYKILCARWYYPKHYAQTHPLSDLPSNFQFYVQSNFRHLASNQFITAPSFSIAKVKFERDGNFKSTIEKQEFQLIRDFNNYLKHDFDKGDRKKCLIKLPKPADYQSNACRMFHPKTRIDLQDTDPDGQGIKYADCYSFDAFPGNSPLSMHLRFRQQYPVKPHCPKAAHFAVTAYNELGFPIGRPVEDTITHYDYPYVLSTDNRYCSDEDVEVDHDSIYARDHGVCPFYSNSLSGLTPTTISDFYLQEATPTSLPHLLALGIHPQMPTPGICFHWLYDPQPAGQRTPKFVQFYLEFFSPLSDDNIVVGTEFVMRSKKFEMKYVAGTTLPGPLKPAKKCHDETDPFKIFKPVPPPTDNLVLLHNYTIYPDKFTYRRCYSDSIVYKTCSTKFTIDEAHLPIVPIVIIPGPLDKDDKDYVHRYDSTKAIYNGCVASKLCYSPLQGDRDLHDCLLEMDCELVWAFGKQPIHPMDAMLPDPTDNNEIVIELYATTTGWTAMALSDDRQMGEDIVLECVKDNTTGVVKAEIYNSWNVLLKRTESYRRHNNIRYPPGLIDPIGRLVHSSADADSVHCIFYVPSSFQARSLKTQIIHNFDLTSERYCILTAYGDTFKISANVNKTIEGIDSHKKGKRKGYASCKEVTDLSSRIMPSRSEVSLLQHHGTLMTVAVMGLSSCGCFVARYYKTSLSYPIFGYESWIWIHGICAVAAGIILGGGFVLNLLGTSNWQTPLSSPFHRFMGYLSILIFMVNIPIGIYIRNTSPEMQKHSFLYIFHDMCGHFALVAGLFIILLSTHLEYAFSPCVSKYVAGTYVVLYFSFHVVMSFNRRWLNKWLEDKKNPSISRPFTLTPFILLTQNAPPGTRWHDEPPRATTVRIAILGLYILITVAFTGAIFFLIITSDHSCSLEKSLIYS